MNPPLRPPEDVLHTFGVTEDPVRLQGGLGKTWRAGNVVLKPTSNIEETSWCAALIESLPQDEFRIARHKKSENSAWVYNGWEALEFIEGTHISDHWKEKIEVCRGFNKLLLHIEKPEFIDKRTDPWAIAGKMTWEELPLQFDERLTSYVEKVTHYFKPITSQSQIVHGDITGNMLFDPTLPPGIIDFTPTYRPEEYAVAILIVDALTWEGADESIFALVKNEEQMDQFLLRAALFRTLDTSEFYRQYGIDRFSELPEHERVLNLIIERYNLRS